LDNVYLYNLSSVFIASVSWLWKGICFWREMP